MFASGGPDNIKQWKCPEGKFIQNLSGHNAIVNCLAANADGVLVSGADNGTMYFWDWKTGYNFQRFQVGLSWGWKTLAVRLKISKSLSLTPSPTGRGPAGFPGLRGRHLPDEVRPVRLETDHLRGRQDH